MLEPVGIVAPQKNLCKGFRIQRAVKCHPENTNPDLVHNLLGQTVDNIYCKSGYIVHIPTSKHREKCQKWSHEPQQMLDKEEAIQQIKTCLPKLIVKYYERMNIMNEY